MVATSAVLGNVTNSATLRTALRELGFTARKSLDDDIRETQFSIVHPQSDQVELAVVINVKNVFYKDGAYESVNMFTLVKGLPLNTPEHPLNIVVGMPQMHDTALLSGLVQAVAERFRALDVDDEVLNRYNF